MLQLKPERLDVGDFDEQAVSVCGKTFTAHVSGALYWPAEDALIVADLCLQRGSREAEHGVILPSHDTREMLSCLTEAIDHFSASTVIALGAPAHDPENCGQMDAEDRETLNIIQDSVEWIWITDHHADKIARDLGGHVRDQLTVGGLTLRHRPETGRTTHEIAGHLHPAAKLSMHGYSIRRPSFIGNGLRLILPEFAAFTGGLNVLDQAFDPLFGNDGFSVWMMGHDGLYPVATRLLTGDDTTI